MRILSFFHHTFIFCLHEFIMAYFVKKSNIKEKNRQNEKNNIIDLCLNPLYGKMKKERWL